MNNKTPYAFIGRSDALRAFYDIEKNLDNESHRNKNVVYYYGQGGIGKTWLLKKIFDDNSSVSQSDKERWPYLKATEIIDFFDTQNHSVHGLQNSIKERLEDLIGSNKAFEEYDKRIEDFNALRQGKSKWYKKPTENDIEDAFFKALSKVVTEYRNKLKGSIEKEKAEIVLLFDTFDDFIRTQPVGEWFVKHFIKEFQKIRRMAGINIVVAGRPVKQEYSSPILSEKNKEVFFNVVFYKLKGFTREETHRHVAHIAEKKSIPCISDSDIDEIYEHTEGVPLWTHLILDLPDSGEEDSREKFIAKLRTLNAGETVNDKEELKREVVRQFEGATERNRVIWAMTFLKRRFDKEILDFLLQEGIWFEKLDIEKILNDLEASVYIKEYAAGQSHLLHDEIQSLIEKYVINELVDPCEEMRVPLYDLIVNKYYKTAINQKAKKKENSDLVRQLAVEQLGYILDLLPKAGINKYKKYQEDIHSHSENENSWMNYDFEELLWSEINVHLTRFDDKGYQICEDRVSWLNREMQYQSAIDFVEQQMEQRFSKFEEISIKSYQKLGFAKKQAGELDEATNICNECLKRISKSNAIAEHYAATAEIYSMLGQIARKAGRWQDAEKNYSKGIDYAKLVEDQERDERDERLASLYLNRGYLNAQQGWIEKAIRDCEDAIILLEALPHERQNRRRRLGYAYMNLGAAFCYGAAYCYNENHDRANECYNKNYDQANEYYRESKIYVLTDNSPDTYIDLLQQFTLNGYRKGVWLHCKYIQNQELDLLPRMLEEQTVAYRNIIEALYTAIRKSDSPELEIAESSNYLAHVYYEISFIGEEIFSKSNGLENNLSHRFESFHQEVKKSERLLDDILRNYLDPISDALNVSVSRYKDRSDVDYWRRYGSQLFNLSTHLAGSISDYLLVLDSLLGLSRLYVISKNAGELNVISNWIKKISSQVEDNNGVDVSHEVLFKAVINIVNGNNQFYRHKKTDDINYYSEGDALNLYADGYANLASASGYDIYLLLDLLQDLKLCLCKLKSVKDKERWYTFLYSKWTDILKTSKSAGSEKNQQYYSDWLEELRKDVEHDKSN